MAENNELEVHHIEDVNLKKGSEVVKVHSETNTGIPYHEDQTTYENRRFKELIDEHAKWYKDKG